MTRLNGSKNMKIVEYNQVDPLQVLYLNMLENIFGSYGN